MYFGKIKPVYLGRTAPLIKKQKQNQVLIKRVLVNSMSLKNNHMVTPKLYLQK